VQALIYTTLLFICYIANVRFHESTQQHRIEIVNELILVCLCYHFVLFADEMWEMSFREHVGSSTVVFVMLLLGLNTVIILFINARLIKLKIKAKCAVCIAKKNKAKALKDKEEQALREKEEIEAKKKAALAAL